MVILWTLVQLEVSFGLDNKFLSFWSLNKGPIPKREKPNWSVWKNSVGWWFYTILQSNFYFTSDPCKIQIDFVVQIVESDYPTILDRDINNHTYMTLPSLRQVRWAVMTLQKKKKKKRKIIFFFIILLVQKYRTKK